MLPVCEQNAEVCSAVLTALVQLVILGKTKDNSECTAASEVCPLVRGVEV
jgi:hypothetical protein